MTLLQRESDFILRRLAISILENIGIENRQQLITGIKYNLIIQTFPLLHRILIIYFGRKRASDVGEIFFK